MDREKVIKGLEHCDFGDLATCHECPYYQSHDCTDELKNDILALLKEQEPLEPTRVEIEQAGPLYYRCYCKKCGHHVGNMFKNKVADVHENFCSICGKAVKWDEVT